MSKAEFPAAMITKVHGRVREFASGIMEADRKGQDDTEWTKIVVDFFGGFCILKPPYDEFSHIAKHLAEGQEVEAAGLLKQGSKGWEIKQLKWIKDARGNLLYTSEQESPADASANVPGESATLKAAPAPARKANIFGSGGTREAA